MTTRIALSLLLAHASLVVACSDDAPVAERAALLDGLARAGLAVTDLAAIDTSAYGASSCERGLVEKLLLTLCVFADESAAAKSAEPMEDLAVESAQTAVARARGRAVVVVADPGGVDPNGKTIARVVKALAAPAAE